MDWLDKTSLPMLAIAAVLMALAPFYPEPHLVEKIRWLIQGTLKRPLDIFDLFFHAAPAVLLIVKLVRMGANH